VCVKISKVGSRITIAGRTTDAAMSPKGRKLKVYYLNSLNLNNRSCTYSFAVPFVNIGAGSVLHLTSHSGVARETTTMFGLIELLPR
jgi:hypothetical protein